jgi:hypothetical protein
MTNSSSKEVIERLGRVQGAPRVTSGSSADVQLQPPENLTELHTIAAIETLARRGVQIPLAKVSIETLVRDPSHPVNVHVPRLEGQKEFASEMAANGVHVVFLTPQDAVTSRSGR